MKKPALTLYDIGEIMAARMHGATCQVLGERYGRSAETIRQIIIRNTEGSAGRAGRPTKNCKRTAMQTKTNITLEQAAMIDALFVQMVSLDAISQEYYRLHELALSHSSHSRTERDIAINVALLSGDSEASVARRFSLSERQVRRIRR